MLSSSRLASTTTTALLALTASFRSGKSFLLLSRRSSLLFAPPRATLAPTRTLVLRRDPTTTRPRHAPSLRSTFFSVRGGSFATAASSSTSTVATETLSTSSDTAANTPTMSSSSTASERLEALRLRMKELDLDVYLVPSDDPHLSEYVPDAYKRRQHLTGFSGSAGTAVVTATEAFLWTDSRYWNQAEKELDMAHWTIKKAGSPKTPTIAKWLGETACNQYKEQQENNTDDKPPRPLRIGLDPFVHSASFAKDVKDAFEEQVKQELDDDDDDDENDGEGQGSAAPVIGVLETSHPNLIDELWTDRPAMPASPFRVHPVQYAGKTVQEKLDAIREEMGTKRATMAVLCALDEVAYLFNIRAMGDIDTCPVGIAYAAVTSDAVFLYCDPVKVDDPVVKEHLEGVPVTVRPYEAIADDIKAHCAAGKTNKVWLDKTRSNFGLASAIPVKRLIDKQNAVTPMKACKNEAELDGMRRAHVVDGAAMAHFMAWLEDAVRDQGRSVSEVEIDEVLTGYRAKQPGYLEPSFPTIAGVGSNGAIVHYRAEPDSDLLQYLDKTKPILIDSGGQYEYGTTDVTRTWYLGESPPPANDDFRLAYTRVLKGHIGLDQQVFPENTPGFVLDLLARRHLWFAKQDYGHGTGHGVGAALNVHEGPQSISPRWTNKEVLKAGMVLSNEPGFYADGKFGVRIENLLEVRAIAGDTVNGDDATDAANGAGEETKGDDKPAATDGKKFLKFEKLTMIPIQKDLICMDLMSEEELDWLDAYHATVLEKVSPLLPDDSPAAAWLRRSCHPIDRTTWKGK